MPLDIYGLEFRLDRPEDVPQEMWGSVQNLLQRNYAEALGVQPDALDDFVRLGQLALFRNARIDPQVDVQAGRLRPNQLFFDPWIISAHDSGNLVGYLYSYNNVSGETETERRNKQAKEEKRHNVIREAAVHAAYRERRILTTMAGLLLERRTARQPTDIYVWQALRQWINKLTSEDTGFEAVGDPHPTTIGGIDTHTQQLRIPTFKLRKKLEERNGFEAAVQYAKTHLQH